jgi:Photosynthetic reaction centre protein
MAGLCHVVALCRIAFLAGLNEMACVAYSLNIPFGVTTSVVYPVYFGGYACARRVGQRADLVWANVFRLQHAALLGVATIYT